MNKKHKIRRVNSSPRACAIHLLTLSNQGSFANELVPSFLNKSSFNNQEKATVTHIVYSTLRKQLFIDYILEQVSSRKLKDLDEIALNAMRVVTSQILDGNDDYGVVNDVVNAMPFSMKGYVNAVSRKISKQIANLNYEEIEENIVYGFPKWIYDLVKENFENYKDVLEALNANSAVTLASIYKNDIQIKNSIEGSLVNYSRLVKSQGKISEIIDFSDEMISIDQGSLLVAHCVDSTTEMEVLDACAAPGGKTLMISTKAKKVLAVDQTLSRMQKFSESIDRLKIQNVHQLVADSKEIPISEKKLFDRILLDAPCSGLGVMKRRPDLRHRITQKDIEYMSDIQKALLDETIKYLKPGGKIIYSVCTFTKEETLHIDNYLKEKYPNLIHDDLTEIHRRFQPRGRGVILAPGKENDSMFALRLTST